jgi:hypothetical protein
VVCTPRKVVLGCGLWIVDAERAYDEPPEDDVVPPEEEDEPSPED